MNDFEKFVNYLVANHSAAELEEMSRKCKLLKAYTEDYYSTAQDLLKNMGINNLDNLTSSVNVAVCKRITQDFINNWNRAVRT